MVHLDWLFRKRKWLRICLADFRFFSLLFSGLGVNVRVRFVSVRVTCSSFLPSLQHSRCVLPLRHSWHINKFSNFKILRGICSHCLRKTHMLALLQDNCLDLLHCAFLCKLSACLRNITAFCQDLLRPIISVVLVDTDTSVKPKYQPICWFNKT